MTARMVKRQRRTLVKITQDGKKYGLTFPIAQARELAKAPLPYEHEERKTDKITIRHEPNEITVKYNGKRPLKMAVREFLQLQKQLRETLYFSIPLKTLFERNPQSNIHALPPRLRECHLILPKMDGWELNWNLMPLALSKNNAYIVITAKPSRPDTMALWHLPELDDEDIRKRLPKPDDENKETPTYAKRVQRTRKDGKSRIYAAVKPHPSLAILITATSPPKKGKEAAVALDLLAREMELAE